MKEIYINADDYNSDSIRTIQGNNNAEEYKIYLQYDNEKIDLTNKTVNLAFLKVGSTDGDIIENLNVTDPVNGEITLKITNKLTRKNGTYSCQLAILGEGDFLEHTATFTLTVENNIFKDITKAIADSKDFTYLERILEEAKTVSGDLKTNIPIATNLNSSLESNISNSRNINTILADTTEKSKVAAMDAIEKKSQLEKSITKAKEFIDGLDGSQNIPQLRLDVTELQNGLKSNQALAYKGSSINAENTLEGRTEGMRIDGITLLNCILTPIINRTYTANSTQQMYNYKVLRKANATYTIIAFISKNTLNNSFSLLSWGRTSNGNPIAISNGEKGLIKKSFTTNYNTEDWFLELWKENTTGEIKIDYMMVLEGDWTNKDIPSYFEGLKSFGEAEQEGDKYKISILSSCKNILKPLKSYSTINGFNLNNILKNGVQYTVTNTKNQLVKIAEFKDADTFLGQSTNGKFTFTFDNSKQQKLYIWKKYDSQVAELFTNEDIDFVMIEEGTGTIFEPYKEDKKDILIKEPVRKSDYLYEDNGQVKVNRESGQHTFTGNENIILDNSLNTDKTLFFYCPIENVSPKGVYHGYCNTIPFYQTNKRGEIYTNKSEGCFAGDGINKNIQFFIDKSKLTTPNVEGFKAWLKANPTTVVYQLDTPTVEVVDGVIDIDLDTFGEKTYFNILNSLPGTLDFKVPSNIGSVVQNMAKEVNNIWDVINNLLVPSIVDVNKKVALATIKNNLK